jgi:phosphatidate phosphatase APP1
MRGWRDDFLRLAGELRERVLDTADVVADRVTGADPRPAVLPYLGYGRPSRVLVLGRVVRGGPLGPAAAADSRWRNAVNTYRRLRSDPVPHARVSVRAGGAITEIEADDEGFLHSWVDLPAPLLAGGLVPIDLELVAPRPGGGDAPARATSQVLVPDASARFGVISDIDDTVIQSHVTDFLRAARTVLLENAQTRLPFPGVSAFYRALARGPRSDGAPHAARNPIFYVSSSPWNLHDVIADFMAVQRIPQGPLLLRDWDLSRGMLGAGRHHGHKGTLVREIFGAYPDLPFILVGDSGEQDPEIYAEVVRHHPQRVKAIYIRSVDTSAARLAAVDQLIASVRASGAQLVLVPDSEFAAVHAAGEGWISPAAVAAVRADVRADKPGATAADDSPP